jgi:hypothetical protein
MGDSLFMMEYTFRSVHPPTNELHFYTTSLHPLLSDIFPSTSWLEQVVNRAVLQYIYLVQPRMTLEQATNEFWYHIKR